jgi:hypothetical protein
MAHAAAARRLARAAVPPVKSRVLFGMESGYFRRAGGRVDPAWFRRGGRPGRFRARGGMSITVCEEIILLTVNDEGKLLRWSEELAVRAAVAGASLIDLAFRGRIDNDISDLFIVSKEPTGEPHLDVALEYLTGKGERMPIQTAVYDVMEVARDIHALALDRLVDRGILAKKDESFLWVLKSRRYPPRSSVIQQEAKLRILSVLMSDDIPTPEDVALISLAYETRILELFMSPAEIERLSARIQEVGNLELIAQAVSAVISDIRTASPILFMAPL